jgi:hypothetical protein
MQVRSQQELFLIAAAHLATTAPKLEVAVTARGLGSGGRMGILTAAVRLKAANSKALFSLHVTSSLLGEYSCSCCQATV